MAYHYENLKLEKGMYSQSGRSFAQTLEALDPSERPTRAPLWRDWTPSNVSSSALTSR